MNRHLESIIPSVFRKVDLPAPKEGIAELPDGDFLEFDHYGSGSKHLVILCHGLEGNSRKAYMLGMAKAMLQAGFDVVAWNYRCCGKQVNRLDRLYHCGATDDLSAMVDNFKQGYESIRLIGFSLGGNLILKYLGETPDRSGQISGAVAISVPIDIGKASLKLSSASNYVYSRYFLSGMKRKIRKKAALSESMKKFSLEGVNSVLEFDDRVTAPLHGFASAMEYYELNSASRFMDLIRTPSLIINAKNDPFLTPECSPVKRFSNHPFVRILTPDKGGHVGFSRSGNSYWTEEIAVRFFTSQKSR